MAILTDWTLEQFLRLPEVKPALEYESGRISQKVSPTTEHSLLQKHLCNLFDALGRGQAFPELRTILPTGSKVPDIAFYSTPELPISPAGRWLRYPEWAPTVAVEIASPDQDFEELRAKCRFYIGAGSRLALLVLPETESLEVFSTSGSMTTATGTNAIPELVRALGSGATSLTPAAIFSVLRPRRG